MFFATYSHGGNNFCSPFLRMLHIKFGFEWPSGFRGDVSLNRLQRRRSMEHGYTISSPCEHNGSGELKKGPGAYTSIQICIQKSMLAWWLVHQTLVREVGSGSPLVAGLYHCTMSKGH